MAKTLKERNQLECNKRARKKYNKENYKYQSIAFPKEEHAEIMAYCEQNNIPKNTFFREACVEYMKN